MYFVCGGVEGWRGGGVIVLLEELTTVNCDSESMNHYVGTIAPATGKKLLPVLIHYNWLLVCSRRW